MYSVAFIFEPGDYDAEFLALDALILQVAESSEGYLGKESWQTADGAKLNSTYYWRDQEALKAFSLHPKHVEAKRQYAKWYKGYHVVIAKVERAYGDGYFDHLAPNERARRSGASSS